MAEPRKAACHKDLAPAPIPGDGAPGPVGVNAGLSCAREGGAMTAFLDTDHLARATFEDADLEAELLDLFRDQCRRLAPGLAGEGAAGQRREDAHTLKGAARAIGAGPLAESLERLEAALAERADPPPRAELAAFAAALGPTLAALEARRAVLPA